MVALVFSSPNFVNKTSGTSNSKIYEIVILTVANIGGITRGILRVYQVRKVLILTARIFRHDHAFGINQNYDRISPPKKRRNLSLTPFPHPTIRNG